jgi:hypothetical protein
LKTTTSATDVEPTILDLLQSLANQPVTLQCVGLLAAQAVLQFVYGIFLTIATENITSKLRTKLFGKKVVCRTNNYSKRATQGYWIL